MVTEETIAKRLKRFEALADLKYSEEVLDIWADHFKGTLKDHFNATCNLIEKRVKFHILPTLNDFYKEAEGWKQP